MNPFQPRSRRRNQIPPRAEALETRQLLTGGAGDTFAIIPGEVTKAAQPAVVKFTLDTSHFTFVHGKGSIGIDVATPTGSNLTPSIKSVKAANNDGVHATMSRAMYAPNLQRSNTSIGPMTSAVVSKVGISSLSANHTASYNVTVTGKGNTTGKFLLGFYLPGDANGDGKVDNSDVAIVKSEMGAKAGATNSKYTFDADANRDGRITPADLRITKENLGMSTTESPIVSANLDPASDSGIQDRVTTIQDVKFTGTATPGAAVKYTETMGMTSPVATAADSKGNYTIVIPLAQGSNTFQVTTQDAFGQSITGTISPVTYQLPSTTNSTNAGNSNMTTYSALSENANGVIVSTGSTTPMVTSKSNTAGS